MAVSDGDEIMVVKDMGLVSARVRRPHARGAHRVTWPSGTPATRRPGRARGATRSPCTAASATPRRSQFALGHNGNLVNTEALADEAGMLPGTVTSDSDLVAELLAAEIAQHRDERSDGRALERALRPSAAPSRGRVLVRAGRRGPRHRRARPQRLPAAVPRPARRRLGAGVGDAGARHRRRPLRPRARSRRDGGHRRRRACRSRAPVPRASGSTRRCACSSSCTSPAPTAASTAAASTRPASRMGEQLAEQAPVEADMVMGVPESGVPAAEGFARAQRHPVRPGPGEEPLHRPQLHRAEPGAARPRPCA